MDRVVLASSVVHYTENEKEKKNTRLLVQSRSQSQS